MTEPEIPTPSYEAQTFLLSLIRIPNQVPMLSANDTWMMYDAKKKHLEDAPNAGDLAELYARQLIEPSHGPEDLALNYEIGGAFASACNLTELGMRYLEQHQLLAAAAFAAGTAYRGLYTLEQYESLQETAYDFNTVTRDLMPAFSRMHPIIYEGEIYQHRNSHWRIFYEDGDPYPKSVQINKSIVHAWETAKLIERHEGGDHYYSTEGYGNCHTLTKPGADLAFDVNAQVLDPVDARLTLFSYMQYLERRLARTNLVQQGIEPTQACENYLLIMHAYALLHPDLVENDPGYTAFSKELTKRVLTAKGAHALEDIKRVAEQLTHQVPSATALSA